MKPPRPVRGVFLADDAAGGRPNYWEREWSSVDHETELAKLLQGPSPVLQAISPHLPSTGRILEAGCGSGVIAAALRQPGRTIVGVDYALAAISAALGSWPELPLVGGEIRQLPFADGSFDAIVSLGVVEHQHLGPAAALLEHRRVLKPNGLFVCSVPSINPVKQLRDRWFLRHRPSYVARSRTITRMEGEGDAPACIQDHSFHQYEYAPAAFRDRLRTAGFVILSEHPYLVSATLGEIDRLRRRHLSERAGPAIAAVESSTDHRGLEHRSSWAHTIKPAILEQSTDLPRLTNLSQRLMGHMRLYVARVR